MVSDCGRRSTTISADAFVALAVACTRVDAICWSVALWAVPGDQRIRDEWQMRLAREVELLVETQPERDGPQHTETLLYSPIGVKST